MTAKVGTGAFNFTPGPNGEMRPMGKAHGAARGAGMDPRQRMTTSMAGAAPSQQFTPDQSYFRRSVAQGRWTTDFNAGACAPANRLRQDPTTGCVDMIALEPWYNENGADQFVDLGGKGGVDFAAGRPS